MTNTIQNDIFKYNLLENIRIFFNLVSFLASTVIIQYFKKTFQHHIPFCKMHQSVLFKKITSFIFNSQLGKHKCCVAPTFATLFHALFVLRSSNGGTSSQKIRRSKWNYALLVMHKDGKVAKLPVLTVIKTLFLKS